MIPLHKIAGQLGNQMFEFAFCYSYAREHNLQAPGAPVDYYFCDLKWFEKYQDEIKQLYGRGISACDNRVALGVRRADYVTNPVLAKFFFNLSKTSYYQDAVNLFPGERFLVISDDIPWCRQMFCGDCYDFHEQVDPVTDMNKMASCKSQICANSTFHWWAAYLNPNPQKTVVYPKQYFMDGRGFPCPPEWILL